MREKLKQINARIAELRAKVEDAIKRRRKIRRRASFDGPNWVPRQYHDAWKRPWEASADTQGFRDVLWRNGYLSPHITRAEFASKAGAPCGHCAGPVDTPYRDRSHFLCFRLEKCRHDNGDQPLTFLSAFRTTCRNSCVGGASASQHVQGTAIDPSPMAGPGSRLHASFRKHFANGGIGYDGYIGGPIRHVDTGPKRQWVY